MEKITLYHDEIVGHYHYYLTPGGHLYACRLEKGRMYIMKDNFSLSGSIKEWTDMLRRKFAMPDLEMWVVMDFIGKPPLLPDGHYQCRILEQEREAGVCSSDQVWVAVHGNGGEELAMCLISPKIELYYENYDPGLIHSENLQVEDWEVYLRYETDNWLKYIGQFWEFEVLRRPGGFYLVTNCAGHPWSLYPLVGKFAADIGKADSDIIIRLDFVGEQPPPAEHPDSVIMRFPDTTKPGLTAFDLFDVLKDLPKSGEPIPASLPHRNDQPPGQAVLVSPKATVMIGLLNAEDLE